jgi:hypothetical protein
MEDDRAIDRKFAGILVELEALRRMVARQVRWRSL